jgi:hypothetical protein
MSDLGKLDVNKLMKEAIQHFWRTRESQSKRQGSTTGIRDTGNRTAVTGGRHADGFVNLVKEVVENAGVKQAHVRSTQGSGRKLPGFFRPSKEWDFVVSNERQIIAVVEVKSQVGSFGNNFNNRVEEAIGNGVDFWEAYNEGIYEPSTRPWLGYLLMIEDAPRSINPTQPVTLEPFSIDKRLNGLSYAKRYEEFGKRLVRKRLYDAVCLVMSKENTGINGEFSTPSNELSTENFCRSLYSHTSGFTVV